MKKKGIFSLISNYKLNSLFVRSFLLILFLIIIPLLGMTIIVYHQMNKAVENEMTELNSKSLTRIANSVDSILKESNRLAAQLALEEEVRLFLITNYLNREKNEIIYRNLKLYSSTYDHIDSIYIYSEMNNWAITNRFNGTIDKFPEQSLFEVYNQINEDRLYIIPRSYNDYYPNFISIYRPFYLNEKKLGVIVVNMSVKGLRALVSKQNEGHFEDLYIVDNQTDSIIYSKDTASFMKPLNDEIRNLLVDGAISEIYNMENGQYLATKQDLIEQDWSIYSFIPLTVFEERLVQIRHFIIIVIISSIFTSFIISLIVSFRTYKPLTSIISALEGKIVSRKKNKHSHNELSYIYQRINHQVQNNQTLEKQLHERMVLVNEAQTIALQAQMNPHFLSNTLETMKWKAMELTGGENELSEMAISLSTLFRFSLGKENSLIPIKQEIELNKKYLQIMEIRYKNKFILKWDLDSSLLKYNTVLLTLQPVIENAIHHGIRPSKRQGLIEIRLGEHNENIHLTVYDNGVGIPEEKLKELNERLADIYSLDGKHIGIRNVNQRIKLLFGEQYGVQVQSVVGEGTIVTISLPKFLHDGD